MMNRIKILTKYFLKNAFEDMFGKNKKSTAFLLLMLAICAFSLSVPFIVLVSSAYENMKAIGFEKLLIDLILYFGSSIACFFGIYSVMNVFYFSDDTEEILPLPFTGGEIVFSKFITVLVNMYFYTAITLPPLIFYGKISNSGILFYVYIIFIFIFQPIIPMVLSSLICIILMRFTNLSKHKDAFRMFTGCFSLILIVAINFFSSNTDSAAENSQKLLDSMRNGSKSIDILEGIFISDKFSSSALVNSSNIDGLKYMILTIISCVIVFVIYYFLTGNLYLKGIIGSSESSGKRKDILKEYSGDKFVQRNSILKSLVYKDIKIIFRTPQFFTNCVAMILYMPAIIGISFFKGGGLEFSRKVVTSSNEYGSQVVAAAFVLGCLCVMTGGAASTALSREGKDIMVSMYLPLDHKVILNSKIISSLIINGIGIIITCGTFIFLNASLIMIIAGTICSACAILLISMIGIYIDFRSPKMDWENERAMFKKNYSVLIIMLATFLLGVGIFIISNFISNYIIMTLLCIVISLVLSYLLKLRINRLSIKFWKSKMMG